MTQHAGTADEWWLIDHDNTHTICAIPRDAVLGAEVVHHDFEIVNGRDDGYTDDIWSRTAVANVPLSSASLCQLRDALHDWLALSLPEMARHRFTYDSELSFSQTSAVSLRFGERDDLILSAGQTAAHFFIATGLGQSEIRLVVTPTELEGLARGLARTLARTR